MIKIEYQLEQKGTFQKFSIDSNIDKKLSSEAKRFTLTGKNGKGKSFLMNLIAFGLLQEQRIDNWFISSISQKVASLGDENLYALNYKFELVIGENESIVSSKNDDGQRMVQFKKSGKLSAPVSFTVLDKLIDVIYDIPVDIDSRLENVLSSVSVEIKDLEAEIRDSLDNLSNIRLSATDVRDETKIAQLVRQTESLDSLELLPKREKLRELMKARTSINLLTTVSNYAKCLGDLERSVDEQSKLDKRLKGKTKPMGSGDNQAEIDSLMKEASSIERQFIKDRDVFYSAIDESQIVKDKLSELCPDELEIIRGFLDPIAMHTEQDVIESARMLISCNDKIKMDLLNDETVKLARNLDLIKTALKVLVDNSESATMSVIFGKSIDEVIEAIEVKSRGFDKTDYNLFIRGLNEKIKNMSKPLNNLFRINGKIEKARKKTLLTEADKKLLGLFERRAQIKKERPSLEREVSKGRTILLDNLEDASFVDDYEKMVILKSRMKSQSNISKYTSFDKFGMDRVQKDIQDLKINLATLEEKREDYQTLIQREQTKPAAPFGKEKIDAIDKQISMLSLLLIEVENWNTTLVNYRKGKAFYELNDSEQRLFDILGQIIANSFDGRLFLDDGKEVQVSNYNLLTKNFETDGGSHFYSLEYLSTGISSSNYLRQKIRQSKKQYVIVFIDEIGDMDSESLGLVQKEIEKVDNEQRLLLSLLATPSNNVNLNLKEF